MADIHRLFTACLLTLLFFVSLGGLALQSLTLKYSLDAQSDHIQISLKTNEPPLGAATEHPVVHDGLDHSSTRFAIAASTILMVVTLSSILTTFIPARTGSFKSTWSSPHVFVAGIFIAVTIISLATLGAAFADNARSESPFSILYDYTRSDAKFYDYETWVCGLADSTTTFAEYYPLWTQCHVARAAKWLLVPEFFLSFTACIALWSTASRIGAVAACAEKEMELQEKEARSDMT